MTFTGVSASLPSVRSFAFGGVLSEMGMLRQLSSDDEAYYHSACTGSWRNHFHSFTQESVNGETCRLAMGDVRKILFLPLLLSCYFFSVDLNHSTSLPCHARSCSNSACSPGILLISNWSEKREIVR